MIGFNVEDTSSYVQCQPVNMSKIPQNSQAKPNQENPSKRRGHQVGWRLNPKGKSLKKKR